MSKVKIKLNRKSVATILKSSGVQADLRKRAGRIASAAGPGFEARTSTGRSRARASVITTTPEARLAQAQNRALSNAVSAGR